MNGQNNQNNGSWTRQQQQQQQRRQQDAALAVLFPGNEAAQRGSLSGMGQAPSQAPLAPPGMGQRMPVPQAHFAPSPPAFVQPGAYIQAPPSFSPSRTPTQQYPHMPQFSQSPASFPRPGQYMPAQQSFSLSGMYGAPMIRNDSGYNSASPSRSPQYSPSVPSQKRSYGHMSGSPATAAASQPQAKRMRLGTSQNPPPSYGTPEWQAVRGMFQPQQVPPPQHPVSTAMAPPRAPAQVTGVQQARQLMGRLAQYGTPAMKRPPPAPAPPNRGSVSSTWSGSSTKAQQPGQNAIKPQPPKRPGTPIPPPTLRAPISYAPPPAPQPTCQVSLEEQIRTLLPQETARLQAISDRKARQEAAKHRPQIPSLTTFAIHHFGLVEGPLTSAENGKALVDSVKARMKKYGPATGTNPDFTIAAEYEFTMEIRARWTVEALKSSKEGRAMLGLWYPAEVLMAGIERR